MCGIQDRETAEAAAVENILKEDFLCAVFKTGKGIFYLFHKAHPAFDILFRSGFNGYLLLLRHKGK